MGYLPCNAESAIATCDSYNWPNLKSKDRRTRGKSNIKPPKIREFSHHELAAATNGFCADSFLGNWRLLDVVFCRSGGFHPLQPSR